MTEYNLNGQSLDIVAENVKKLRQLFPEIVTEDKIDFARLQDVLGKYIEPSEESYRFTWHGKSNAFKKSQIPSTGTLRPCKEESKDWDTTQNLYIEGDNLEVLKLLQKSYGGKIKMIYIDPPYNKDKDFVYPDKWSDPIKEYKHITGQIDDKGNTTTSDVEIEGGHHTKWLNMIYPRLRLARNLLTDDGVIFISIDEDEVENLKKVCNEIFGEENFVDILHWKKKKQPSFLAKHTAKFMEYILVYAKTFNSLEKLSIENISDETKKVVNISNQESTRNFNTGVRVKIGENGLLKSGKYKIKTIEVEYLNDVYYRDGKTINEVDVVARFSVSQEKINQYINEKLLFITKNNGLRRDVSEKEKKTRKAITDLLLSEYGDNQDSDSEQRELFGDVKYFDYTKPINLIYNFVKSLDSNDFTVLDFFSGLATTAHSVMKLNAEDGGNRRFIMVQLQEPIKDKNNPYTNICELGKERIRRAGEKIKTELKNKYDAHRQKQAILYGDEESTPMYPDELDIGFKVFKLDSSNLNRWALDVDENFHTLEKNEQHDILSEKLGTFINNFVPDRSDLDMVYEVMLKYGIDLTLPIAEYEFRECANGKDNKLYSIGDGALFACFANDLDENLAEFIVEKVKALEPATVRVVVKDLSFSADPDKTNFRETLKTGIAAYFDNANNKASKVELFEFITI